MAGTPPKTPFKSKADNVYHHSQTGRTATFNGDRWLCSCTGHPKMKPGTVQTGPNKGRPFLNCVNYGRRGGCNVFFISDDPPIFEIENKVHARTPGGRQTTLHGFVKRCPRPRPSPEPVYPQLQSSPGSDSTTGSEYYSDRGLYSATPCPSPKRPGPPASASQDLPSRPAKRGRNQEDDDGDNSEEEVIRRLVEQFRPTDPSDDCDSDYSSWDDDITREIIEKTESFAKSRSKDKGPRLGPLQTPSSPPQVTPLAPIQRRGLVIAREKRMAKRQKSVLPASSASSGMTIPAPTPSRAPPRPSSSRASRQSVPGGWESSEPELEFQSGASLEPQPRHDDQYPGGVDDRDLESVPSETPSRRVDVGHGLPTPVTSHARRFGSVALPLGGDQIESPRQPFEDQIVRDIFTTLKDHGIQISSAAKTALKSQLGSFANSAEKLRRDRNEKKKYIQRLQMELGKSKAMFKMVRNQKEEAQISLMDILQEFASTDRAKDELHAAAQKLLADAEDKKLKMMGIIHRFDEPMVVVDEEATDLEYEGDE